MDFLKRFVRNSAKPYALIHMKIVASTNVSRGAVILWLLVQLEQRKG